MTPDGRAVLRGFDGAAIAAVDRDLALDRAQLLVSTALVMGATAAVDVAVEALGPAVVMTAVPYLQPLALPAPTRRAWRSKKEVLDGLRTAIAHATGVEPAPLARLDRIRPRRRCRSWRSWSPSTSCSRSSATSATPSTPPARPTGGGSRR